MIHIKFLGTGAAEGIPAMGCRCPNCTMARKEGGKGLRRRSCLLFTINEFRLLCEAPPEIHNILNFYDIDSLDALLLTHDHFDHSGGITEFEYWPQNLDIWVNTETLRRLQKFWTPKLAAKFFRHRLFAGVPVEFRKFRLVPFRVYHTTPAYGFLIMADGEKLVAYTSDTTNQLSRYASELLKGINYLIVNTPTFDSDTDGHLSMKEALKLKDQLKIQHLILTHINHTTLSHPKLEEKLKNYPDATLAYDGLELEI